MGWRGGPPYQGGSSGTKPSGLLPGGWADVGGQGTGGNPRRPSVRTQFLMQRLVTETTLPEWRSYKDILAVLFMSSVTFVLRRKNRERSTDLLLDHLDFQLGFHHRPAVGQWFSVPLFPHCQVGIITVLTHGLSVC